ncbi:MAG: lipopolysaccharide biosynthesis protein [Planctomycetes bacterium]|nr:lipopolysaccharide biosynthesis protein [Planctomycetota bacterium]
MALHFTEFRRKLLGEGAWVAAGQVVGIIGTLAGIRLLTQFVPEDVYGQASLLLAGLTLGIQALIVPANNATLRFYSDVKPSGRLWMLRLATRRIILPFGGLLLLLVAGVGSAWAFVGGKSYLAVAALAGLAAAESLKTTEITFLTAGRRQRAAAILRVLESWLCPALATAAVLILGKYPACVVGGNAAGIAVVLIFLLALVRREGRDGPAALDDPAKEELAGLQHQMARFARPMIFVAVVTWVSGLSDRFLIGWLLDASQVGIYAPAYGLASFPFLAALGIVYQTVYPHYCEAVSAGRGDLERRAFRYWLLTVVAIAACGVIAFALLKNYIAWLLLAPEYWAGAELMPWIAAGNGLLIISMVFGDRLKAHKRTTEMLIGTAVGAVASIAITIPFILVWGRLGAAFACPCYFGIQLIAMACLAARPPKSDQLDSAQTPEKKRWFPRIFASLLALLLSIITAGWLFFFYDNSTEEKICEVEKDYLPFSCKLSDDGQHIVLVLNNEDKKLRYVLWDNHKSNNNNGLYPTIVISPDGMHLAHSNFYRYNLNDYKYSVTYDNIEGPKYDSIESMHIIYSDYPIILYRGVDG